MPPGLVTPWTAADYDGAVRAALLAHKERHVAGLAATLAELLAVAVAEAAPPPVLLVPVPSRPGVVRARGHDPLLAVVRGAARLLPDAGVAPVLRSRGGAASATATASSSASVAARPATWRSLWASSAARTAPS